MTKIVCPKCKNVNTLLFLVPVFNVYTMNEYPDKYGYVDPVYHDGDYERPSSENKVECSICLSQWSTDNLIWKKMREKYSKEELPIVTISEIKVYEENIYEDNYAP